MSGVITGKREKQQNDEALPYSKTHRTRATKPVTKMNTAHVLDNPADHVTALCCCVPCLFCWLFLGGGGADLQDKGPFIGNCVVP